mmetsp:Transcript_15798/g.23574  ORF Transcript_15798/g.23574 Transcript_15798/m.23574 type:complete len:90 (+) Transcript_15798:1335-1604(+)
MFAAGVLPGLEGAIGLTLARRKVIGFDKVPSISLLEGPIIDAVDVEYTSDDSEESEWLLISIPGDDSLPIPKLIDFVAFKECWKAEDLS